MISLMNILVKELDQRKSVVGFFYLRKVFDMVDHGLLLEKFEIIGIKWIIGSLL